MRYYSLEKREARAYLEGHKETPSIQEKGSGPLLDENTIRLCVEQLLCMIEEMSSSGTLSGERGGRFEARAVPVVHGMISQLTMADRSPLYDDGFWRWLAVCHFRKIIQRRHSRPNGRVNEENFGLGALTDNFVYRVWLRGEIAFDPHRYPEDPYRLAIRGDQDFWRSHIFRQSYAASRSFARALARFQYENDESGRLKPTDRVRELAKRLRRLRVNVVFELLDEEEAIELIQEEAKRLTQ
ncbi:MAG: hypothetical protein J7453_12295 [Thermomicrobium sp.]|nr:hypothetical protein [Thermomicrobium sp.]